MKIDLLASPRRLYIPRYWSAPDTQIISEPLFKRDFPLYAYNNEDKPENWVVKRTVLEKTFDCKQITGIDSTFLTVNQLSNWETGVYRIKIITNDPVTGDVIEDSKEFTLCDIKENVVPCNKTFFAWLNKEIYDVNETATLVLGTAADKINVLIEEELDGQIIKQKWLLLRHRR